MLSLKLAFLKIAVKISSAQYFFYFATAAAQRYNLWASHAEPKYMTRFKDDSALQHISPLLHSALLECFLRALAYTLSVTKHLKRTQSMHSHAHSHVILS